MTLARDDRWLADAQGRALAGAQVYWCTQPASTANNPPSPLASLFTDLTGGTPLAQPVLTDGFGHADAYMDPSVLYTVVLWHPLFGSMPVVLPDQAIGGAASGGTTGLTPFAGTPTGTINGTNTVFIIVNGSTPLTALPAQITVWLNFPLVLGVGYSLAVTSGQLQVTFANAPVTGDVLWAQGFHS